METIEYNVAEQLLVICDEGAYIKGINFPVHLVVDLRPAALMTTKKKLINNKSGSHY
jgi:hypothetical protein